jgi:hypothetical protein
MLEGVPRKMGMDLVDGRSGNSCIVEILKDVLYV